MQTLTKIVDFDRDSETHIDLVVGKASASAVLSIYKELTGLDVVLVNVTVNTSQETVDALLVEDKPHVLYMDKSPCTTLQELQRRIAMEGYLSTLLDCVSAAYRVHDPSLQYYLAA